MNAGTARAAAPQDALERLRALTASDIASTPEIWQARARLTPDATCLVWQGCRTGFGTAWSLIQAIAGRVRSTATTARPRVASYLGNCPETLWAMIGTHRADGVFACLNRGHRGPLLADMLGRTGARTLLTDREALGDLPEGLDRLGFARLVLVGGDPSAVPARLGVPAIAFDDWADHPADSGAMPEARSVATLMFTSGTTGRSKAVLLPHGMLTRGAARLAHALAYRADDVVHSWLPQFHVAAQLHITMTAALAGASVVLAPTFSLSGFWAEVIGHGCTVATLLPAQCALLLEKTAPADAEGHRLRLIMVGPQPGPAMRRAAEERWGVPMRDTYGMTEAEPLTLPEPASDQPPGSCGRANPDFELAIHGPDGIAVPVGVAGELVARPRRSGIMFAGYEGDAEATLAACRDLWFHTGDLARIDGAGNVFVLGRLKHMIRRRGENISAWELEALIGEHADVEECAAVGVPSPLGEEDVKVVVQVKPHRAPDPAALHSWCAGRMARFMVPRYIEIVDSLPRTEIGKVAKTELTGVGANVWDAEA
ncbi:MAG: AMP-binding protein [Azospirillaceae bacterium]